VEREGQRCLYCKQREKEQAAAQKERLAALNQANRNKRKSLLE